MKLVFGVGPEIEVLLDHSAASASSVNSIIRLMWRIRHTVIDTQCKRRLSFMIIMKRTQAVNVC